MFRRFRIPLIEELPLIDSSEKIRHDSFLLVEHDPTSCWYHASLSISSGWIGAGGTIVYDVLAQPPDRLSSQLGNVGLDVQGLMRQDRLMLMDGYSHTTRSSSDKRYSYSLKISDGDLDKAFSRLPIRHPGPPETLRIVDSVSFLSRFNDEKTWVEFVLTKMIPYAYLTETTLIAGVTTGIHPDSTYKLLDAAADGVIEIRLRKIGKDDRGSFISIKSMRNVLFDSRWHRLKVGDKFKVTLEKWRIKRDRPLEQADRQRREK